MTSTILCLIFTTSFFLHKFPIFNLQYTCLTLDDLHNIFFCSEVFIFLTLSRSTCFSPPLHLWEGHAILAKKKWSYALLKVFVSVCLLGNVWCIVLTKSMIFFPDNRAWILARGAIPYLYNSSMRISFSVHNVVNIC